jgi:hypothetical protein
MHASSLQTGTWIYHYNATQTKHSDLSQRAVWKCYKIEPFLKHHCMQRVEFVDRSVRKLFLYEGHAQKRPLISSTSANQIYTQSSSSHDLSIQHLKVGQAFDPTPQSHSGVTL